MLNLSVSTGRHQKIPAFSLPHPCKPYPAIPQPHGKVKFDFFIGSKAKQLLGSPCSHSGAGGFGDPTLGSSSRLRMWEKIQPRFSPAPLAASWLIPPGGAAWPGSLSPPFITEHLFHLPPSCACIKPLLILLSEASQLIGINLIGVTTELMFAGVRENSWLWREIKSNFMSSRFAWGWRVPFPSWKELLQSHSPGKIQVGVRQSVWGRKEASALFPCFIPEGSPGLLASPGFTSRLDKPGSWKRD